MKNKTSIVFTGDIGFDKYMTGKWEDKNLLSPTVLEFFHSADHVCANVEGALIEVDESVPRPVCFHAMNPKATKVLQMMHADLWSIGNNHTMDAGAEGVASTQKIAKSLGCQVFGGGMNIGEASAPIYLDEAGGIGMICLAYMNGCHPATETEPGIFRWDNFDLIGKRIKEIKAKCRWCIIICHGGEEFTALPTPYTRERYLKFLEMGADVVVGHHPHVAENYELLDNGKAVFYSLGNFIFDTDYQRAHPYTDVGVLLKLIFTENEMTFEAVGTQIIRGPEQIDITPLPNIFTNIPAAEYELLAPLAAKGFLVDEKRKMVYLEPETFANCEQAVWEDHILNGKLEEYTKGAHMDGDILNSLAVKSDEGIWKQSKLEKVKQYILNQLKEDNRK